MFERIAQTEAEKDAQAAEGRSPGQIAALRLAALLLVANVAMTIAVVMVYRIAQVPILPMLIALGLAYYLYKLRPRAEALAIGLSLLGAILQPTLLLLHYPFIYALFESLPVLGTSGAVLLLLTGDSGRARRNAAIAIFCVFTVGFYGLAIAGRLAR